MAGLTIQGSKEYVYKKAFDDVIEHYQELKHSSESGLKGIDYSKMHDSSGNTANVVQANKTEFVCDVEIAVRRALLKNPELLDTFSRVYVWLQGTPDTQSPDIDKIRTLVGRALVEARIHPVKAYFKPKHIDRSKGAK